MLITLYGVQLDGWAALNVALQFVLPAVVALVTTKLTGRRFQFLLLLGLTLVTTVGTQAFDAHAAGAPLNLVQIIVTAVINFAISLLSHYGVWKPSNLSDLLLAMFVKAPGAHSPANPVPVPDPSAPISPASPVPALRIVPPVSVTTADPAPAVDAAPVSRMVG